MNYRGIFFLFVFFILQHLGVAQSLQKEQKNKPLKILLLSDLNDSYGSVIYSKEVHEIIRAIPDIKPDIILCGGDMVAGQKAALSLETIQSMWRAFDSSVLTPIEQMKIPFGFTVGNHDASPSFSNDRYAASEFWQRNKQRTHLNFIDATHFPYYFSYLKNNVFFISWDASSAVIADSMKRWMRDQLSSSLAKKARGRIVLGHLPLYAIVAAKNKPGEVLHAADETLQFFKENKVDLYISGHQHAYFPGVKNGVKLLHSGCLGGGPRQLLGHDAPAQKSYAILQIGKRKKMFEVKVKGYGANTNQVITIDELPKIITGFNGSVERINIETWVY